MVVMPFDRLVLTEAVSRTFNTVTEDMRRLESPRQANCASQE